MASGNKMLLPLLLLLLAVAECRERKTGKTTPADNSSTPAGTIRVLFYHNPPDVFDDCHRFPNLKTSSMRCRFPGHCVELLMQIVNHLNLKVEPVIYHTRHLGGYINGTAMGLLKLLANGTVDTICKLFTRTNTNRQLFDFTRTVYATWSSIAVRRHSGQMYKRDMWSLFYPFTTSTWMAVGIMLLVWMVIFPLINLVECQMSNSQNSAESRCCGECSGSNYNSPMTFASIPYQTLSLFEAIFNIGERGNFSYLVYGVLHVMLFCSLYQSWIVTTLVGGQRNLPFQSLEELIPLLESGRYRFAALPINHWFFETVETSNDPRYLRIRAALRQYPLEIYDDEAQVMELVQSGTHVAIVQGGSTLEWMANSFCDVVFVRGGMPEKAIHFAFPKDSEFVKLFNEALGHEAVFMHRKHWKYGYYAEKLRERFCLEHDKERKQFKPLSLIPFLGPCIILLVGFGFASMVFVAELIVHHFVHKRAASAKRRISATTAALRTMANALRAEALCADGMIGGGGEELIEMEHRRKAE